jgi:hypothetical protein
LVEFTDRFLGNILSERKDVMFFLLVTCGSVGRKLSVEVAERQTTLARLATTPPIVSTPLRSIRSKQQRSTTNRLPAPKTILLESAPMKLFAITNLLVFAFTAASFGATPVTFDRQGDQVTVKIGDAPFAVYNFSKELPKPFFSPVYDPNGTIISRPLENPEDHKHHKGIWVSIDEVNDIKFWAEAGKIENVSIQSHDSTDAGPATLNVVNHWLGEDGKPVVIETTTISIFQNRLMIYDIVFTAPAGPVTFGDTKEGLFGFRMINSMREKEGGKVVNAEGKRGTAECWGQASAWVDYYGEAEGKIAGVTIMDHPGNFRPSRYHVRDYGLFTISPFGEKAYTRGVSDAEPVVIEKGESLRLRYGIYFHSGDTSEGKVAEAYQQFLSATN